MRSKSIYALCALLLAGVSLHVNADDEPDIDDNAMMEEPEPEAVQVPAAPEPKVPKAPMEIARAHAAGQCERIVESPLPDDDAYFHFYQNDERLDPNQFVKVVFKIISGYNGQYVKKVTLDYSPQVRTEVGPYPMLTSVTTVKDGALVEQCFEIIITVLDTNECTYKGSNPDWMHTCDASTNCVNTEGSYYCACKEGSFAVPATGDGQCGNAASSEACCRDEACHGRFQCHSDSCAFSDCHPDATCLPGDGPNAFTCACKHGYKDMGGARGYRCEARDHCVGKEVPTCPSGCACESVTNATVDGYFCHPTEGHITYYPSNEDEWETKPVYDPFRLDDMPHLCVAQKAPPLLWLNGQSPLVLEQGSSYHELGARISDEDSGDLKRRFTTDYSDASELMGPFVKKCGSSTVTYVLDTPWIKARPQVSISREVTITDVDECAYQGGDATFQHTCTGLSVCSNLPCGDAASKGFDCVCTDYRGYIPDGAQGCADKRAPVIECVEAGCGTATVFAIKGAGAILEAGRGSQVLFFNSEADDVWLVDVFDQIEAPKLRAYDMEPVKGAPDAVVDLTGAIKKGDVTGYEKDVWVKSYHVEDASGNSVAFHVKFTVVVITADLLLPLLKNIGSSGAQKMVAAAAAAAPQAAAAQDCAAPEGVPAVGHESTWAMVGLVLLWLLLSTVVLSTVSKVLAALAVLAVPRSLDRPRFNVGMDTLLAIQSLGTLNPAERARVTEAKWGELFN